MNKITNLVAMTLISIGLFVGCKNDGTHSKYNPWYITADEENICYEDIFTEYDVIENPFEIKLCNDEYMCCEIDADSKSQEDTEEDASLGPVPYVPEECYFYSHWNSPLRCD